MTWTETLFQLALSLLVAITTAGVTVWLSLRRYYREKWWEAKMRAYTDVIQALHHMKRDLDISLAAEVQGRDAETEYHKQWQKRHQEAWDKIREQMDVGEFLYSPMTVRIIQTLIREAKSDPNESYFERLEKLQAAVDRCLPAIKTAARKDLGLPSIRVDK